MSNIELSIPTSKSIKGTMGTTMNPPIWNSQRFVHNISRCASFDLHPHLSIFKDYVDFQEEASTTYMIVERGLYLWNGNFTTLLVRNEKLFARTCLSRI
jgi:hypothetical protein